MSTGSRIRKYRKEMGLTQAELGEEIGVSDSAIRNYERDIRKPNKSNLKALAKCFGVSEENLLDMGPETARGALEMLFRMEEDLGIVLLEDGDDIRIGVDPSVEGSQKFAQALKAWKRMRDKLKAGEVSQGEYDAWKASFKA